MRNKNKSQKQIVKNKIVNKNNLQSNSPNILTPPLYFFSDNAVIQNMNFLNVQTYLFYR